MNGSDPPNPYLSLSVRERAILYGALASWKFGDDPMCFIDGAHGISEVLLEEEVERILKTLESTELTLSAPRLPEPK